MSYLIDNTLVIAQYGWTKLRVGFEVNKTVCTVVYGLGPNEPIEAKNRKEKVEER